MVAYKAADNVVAVAAVDGERAADAAVAVVDNGRAAADVALALGADSHRHRAQLVVARRHASNLCLPGSAGVPHPPGPAEQPTLPSSEAWSSTDRQSQFLNGTG